MILLDSDSETETDAPQEIKENEVMKFTKRFDKYSITRSNESHKISVDGLAANISANELFISDNYHDIFRVFNVNTEQLDDRDVVTRKRDELLKALVYNCATGTLFIASHQKDTPSITLRAYTRTNSKWQECNCIRLDESRVDDTVSLSALDDKRLACGVGGSAYVQLWRELDTCALEQCARIRLPFCFYFMAATRSGDSTLLATSFWDFFGGEHAVGLFRVDGTRAVELSRILLNNPWRLQWFDDKLFVESGSQWFDKCSLVEMDTTGGQLVRSRLLVSMVEGERIGEWCVLKNSIAMWDFERIEMRIYSFQ